MARTKKAGLNYFPLDTNFFGNKKIVNINQKYGPAGPMALLSIYSEIYRTKGYFLLFDMDMLDYLVYQTGMTEALLFDLLDHCNRRSILTIVNLNEGNIDEFNEKSLPLIITAASVQRQYQVSIKTMKSSQEVDPVLWLLDQDETEDCITFAKSSNFPNLTPLNPNNANLCVWLTDITSDSFGITPDNSGNFRNNSELIGDNRGKTENSLYIKEKKRKENKRNKKKINNNNIAELSETETPCNVDSSEQKDESRKKNNNWVAVSDFKNKMAVGTFKNVYLKGSEIDTLKAQYPDCWEEIIETLSNYKASSGKGYKSDYAAIRQWVIKRVSEDKNRSSPKTANKNDSDDFLTKVALGQISLE